MVKWIGLLPLLLVLGLIATMAPLASASSLKAASVAAGDGYSFAVMDNGTVWAWGDNSRGLLGIDDHTIQYSPVQVPIDHVGNISVGMGYVLALKDDGTVWAWGDENTQPWPGVYPWKSHPTQVGGLSNVKAISAGASHCLALKGDGTVWAWGENGEGDLGDGTYNNSPVPVLVEGLANVKAISAGYGYSVAVKDDGTVWAWGQGVEYVYADGSHTVWTWGDGNDPDPDVARNIPVRHGSNEKDGSCRNVPVRLPLENVTAISCQGSVALALKDDGTVWAWGDNSAYQLGNVTLSNVQCMPVKVDGLDSAAYVSTNGRASFAIAGDGRVFAWGGSDYGTLGNGHYYEEASELPSPVEDLTGVKTMAVGGGHCLAVRDDGTVWAWGGNDAGQLGIGRYRVKFYYPNGSIVKLVARYANGTVDSDAPANPSWYAKPSPVQVIIGQQPAGSTTVLLPLPRQADAVIPDDTPRPANVSVPGDSNWSVMLGKPVDYMTRDEGGNLYAFSGNYIQCIGRDGTQKWGFTIPDHWTICRYWYRGGVGTDATSPWPVYALDNGTLYLYATPGIADVKNGNWYDFYREAAAKNMTWLVLAISSDGWIAWTHTLDVLPRNYDDTLISAKGGRVYVFHGYNETVLNRNGTVLFRIGPIAAPPAIDETGNIYAADAVESEIGADWTGESYVTGFVPGRTVSAYGPDGTLLWRQAMPGYIQPGDVAESLRPQYGTTPIYRNGTLYVPLRRGVEALGTGGSVLWSKAMAGSDTYQFFPLMPVDSRGNVYLEDRAMDDFNFTNDVYVISHEGRDVSPPRKFVIAWPIGTARDGVIYDLAYDGYASTDHGWPSTLDNLTGYTVRAYDIVNDRVLWAYTIPTDHINHVVLNNSNLYGLLSSNALEAWQQGISYPTGTIRSDDHVSLQLDGDTLYVIAREANYEAPVVPGQSRYAYSTGIYAISTKGDIAYERPMSQIFTAAYVNNSTVLIATASGGVSMVQVGAAAGLALVGGLAIAAKLFLAGTVARIRTGPDRNANRSLVLDYVKGHPGSTMNEISRGMGMNMGTVRYHMFILGHSHRIATFNDGKFVRYFPNSSFYSRDEQLAISLIRRDPIKKIITVLMANPGISNAALARANGQANSAMSRMMKELCIKGIAVKIGDEGGSSRYMISEKYSSILEGLPSKLPTGDINFS